MRSFVVALPLSACLAISGGCESGPPREPALALVAEVQAAVERREELFEQALTELATQYFGQVHERLALQWRAGLAELRVHIYTETEARRVSLVDASVKNLEDAIDPVLARIQDEFESASSAGGSGASLERKNRLAAELSATLAVTLRESEKIRRFVEQELTLARDSALESIEEEQSDVPGDFVAREEAERIVAQWKEHQGGAYAESMSMALEQLRRHIDGRSALSLTLKGLVGDELAGRWFEQLERKSGDLLAQGAERMDEWIGRTSKDLSRDLDRKVHEVERPARAAQ